MEFSTLERKVPGEKGMGGRKWGLAIAKTYPDCIADDSCLLSLGYDIIIILVVTFFLPIGDDNENFGGIFAGSISGSEQFLSVRKVVDQEACEQNYARHQPL